MHDSTIARPMRRPRIVVLSQYYEPEPGFITADVARELASVAAVTVVTAHPNYPYGRFYAGSRWWRVSRTVENGITVWRVPCFTTRSTSVALRGLSYLSFAAAAAIIAPIAMPRPDVIWVYHGPFTTALAGLLSRLISGARLAITSADLWPESLEATNVMRPGVLMRCLYAYSRWINRQADLIICSTNGTLERYRRDGQADETLVVVPVWIRGIPEPLGSVAAESEPRTIVYAGNLGPAQGLHTVISAAARLHRTRPDLRFRLYGTGVSELDLRRQAESEGAANVEFMGPVQAERVFQASAAAFAQVVSLTPSPLLRATIPSKLSFALAAGSPILSGLEGEAAAIAEASGASVSFDASDPDTLVAAIQLLIDKSPERRQLMRERARRYYLERFERRGLIARYRELLWGLARG